MNNTDNSREFRLQIDTHHCTLSPAEHDNIREEFAHFSRMVEHFPISDLHVMIEYNNRNNDYSVKTTLILSGATLVGNDHDPVWHAALERCLAGLAENVKAYKEQMGQVPERQKQEKGTHQELLPDPNPDPATVQAALDEGDYAAFRVALLGYEEPLRKRIGRWVERYPEFSARIGKGVELSDLVDEVFLMAFEQFDRRPPGERLGEWLEGLIDPAVRTIQAKGEEELEQIRMAQSAVEATRGPNAV